MTTEQSVTYLDMSKALGISRDRYEHIRSYITQMTKDYQGNVVDIITEIPLNLKEKERYFAMFLVGRYYSPLFSIINNEQKGEFVMEIIDALKINQDTARSITFHIENRILQDTKEDSSISTIDIIKQVTYGDLEDVEKDYILLTIGLAYV